VVDGAGGASARGAVDDDINAGKMKLTILLEYFISEGLQDSEELT
jgi:hypothetical protein